jgi:hypothetical protein
VLCCLRFALRAGEDGSTTGDAAKKSADSSMWARTVLSNTSSSSVRQLAVSSRRMSAKVCSGLRLICWRYLRSLRRRNTTGSTSRAITCQALGSEVGFNGTVKRSQARLSEGQLLPAARITSQTSRHRQIRMGNAQSVRKHHRDTLRRSMKNSMSARGTQSARGCGLS